LVARAIDLEDFSDSSSTEVRQTSLAEAHRKSLPSFRRLPAFALLVAGLFFFSGLAALVYQVTWMRYLALFFGSDVYSAAITLSVFMAGLSLGSYLAERLDGRITQPLFVYSLIEILIGIYALFFTDLLGAFIPLLPSIAISLLPLVLR
jgi:hypothetical protein